MLDAAEALIRQSGGTEFSMRVLAAHAEVSPTTPYNFFGSKEGLLFELLTRNLHALMEEALAGLNQDPIEAVIEAGEAAVKIFLRDPVLMRPLYQIWFGINDPLRHPKFLGEAFEFYRAALTLALQKKLISEAEHLMLASALMSQFLGVLDLWIHEDIDDHWFLAQIAYGFGRLLWPAARGKSLERLKVRLALAEATLVGQKPPPKFVG